ncbi:hypothetical protein SODALDRAFT_215951 [Sodiomyces alkalinus F11]|uniref:Uncharacterized protein n=1 Tax=Sodiomyces alkalinus (strain CBS 110278 / VKM F-3762 / F11) TaxID=1314773 RepID=A0A3N2PPI1_SODAK|nr:hypothetical protein SODALDRAFT_215951 [Sodiomyces alkalinus F11]ROT36266.1 hypothetical protein SODALDRAFT_215951 [Sodiomyces alkalinus F11]
MSSPNFPMMMRSEYFVQNGEHRRDASPETAPQDATLREDVIRDGTDISDSQTIEKCQPSLQQDAKEALVVGMKAGQTKDGKDSPPHPTTVEFTGNFLPRPTEASHLGALDPSKIFRAPPPTFTPNQFSGPQAKPFVPTDGQLEAMICPSSYRPALRLSTSSTQSNASNAAVACPSRSTTDDQGQPVPSPIRNTNAGSDPAPLTLVVARSSMSPDATARSVTQLETISGARVEEPPFPRTEATSTRLESPTRTHNPNAVVEHKSPATKSHAMAPAPQGSVLIDHRARTNPHSGLQEHTDGPRHRNQRPLSPVRKSNEKDREPKRHLPVRDLEVPTQHRSRGIGGSRFSATLDHSNEPVLSSHVVPTGNAFRQHHELGSYTEQRHGAEQHPPFLDLLTMPTPPAPYDGEETAHASVQARHSSRFARERQSSSPVTRPGSQVSNTSRRRGPLVKHANSRRSNRGQLQKTLESWQAMVNDYEKERTELLQAIDQRDDELTKQGDRIARGKHQLKECSNQLESLRRENGDLVQQNHALRDQAKEAVNDTNKVKLELESVHSQLEKLRGRYNSLKEHLNKAIAEQQRLYQDLQASYTKTKEEMRLSHQECESEQSRTLAKMEALRKAVQEAAAAKRAAAEQQREECEFMPID